MAAHWLRESNGVLEYLGMVCQLQSTTDHERWLLQAVLSLASYITVIFMAASSIFQSLTSSGRLMTVAMDDLKVCAPGGQYLGIGTQGLNGCTCVVIIGRAILMAHISPLPSYLPPGTDLYAVTDAHHQRFMDAIQRQLEQDAALFPRTGTAWGIFACRSHGPNGPEDYVRRTVAHVSSSLAQMGYSMRPHFYREVDRPAGPPTGELVAIWRNGITELYMANEKFWSSER